MCCVNLLDSADRLIGTYRPSNLLNTLDSSREMLLIFTAIAGNVIF